MSYHIQARGFHLTDTLINFTRHHLIDALDKFQFIKSMDIKLEDINGLSHGGIDKQCQVVLNLVKAEPVVIRSTHKDMYHAIKQSATRAKNTLSRHNQKNTDMKKK